GSTVELLSMKAGTTVVRPNYEAAQTAADLWIATATEDPEFLESGLGEYVTAAEDIDGVPLPEGLAAEEGDEEDANDPGELSRLRARLQALELAARTAPPHRAVASGHSVRHLQLLNRDAAGAVPARLAQHERAPRTALTREADDTLAEIEAGVTQDDGPTSSGDQVLQRLLLVQTQMLAKLTASKPKSPLEAALGSGGGKDEGSLSAKGSAARDAYVRLLKDSTAVAEQIRRLAAEELGEDIHSPPASLMRTFVEKRSPVGEMRTLALVSTFAAHGWEQARNTANSDMEAGLNWGGSGGQVEKELPGGGKRPGETQVTGLRPFSRLCPSLWLSGNVAFLKEMEWLATRMSNTSDPAKDPPKDPPQTEDSAAGVVEPVLSIAAPCAASAATTAAVPGASEADRIKWTLPPSFNPVPFLVVHATRAQLLKLAAKWDQFQALRIFRCSEIDPLETVGLLEVATSAQATIARYIDIFRSRCVFLGADVDGLTGIVSVFMDARRTPATRIMPLHRDSFNELFCLCAVGPLLQADLRATYPGFLYAMDASPSGAGLCRAALPESVLRELWRHTEQKGFYTKLLEPASALLTDLGLSEDPGAFFVEGLSSASSSPFTPEPLPLRRPCDGLVYFLCLFGGDSNWASAHCRAGLFDYAVSEPSLRCLTFDLGDDGVFHTLAALASCGRVHDWHACPPLSVAESAPSLVRRLCFLLCLAASAGAFVSLALPSACTLLRMHCFRALVAWAALLVGFLRLRRVTLPLGATPVWSPSLGVPFHDDPEWIGELADCLDFGEVVRYKFGAP
ncbi:NLRC3, partial [Symbiodinium necroappetens]